MRIVENLGVTNCGVLLALWEGNLANNLCLLIGGALIGFALTVFYLEAIHPMIKKTTNTPTINIAKKARAKARGEKTATSVVSCKNSNNITIDKATGINRIRENITTRFQGNKIYRHAVMIAIDDGRFNVRVETIFRYPEACFETIKDVEILESFVNEIERIYEALTRVYRFMDDSVDSQDVDKMLFTRLGELQETAKENGLILVRGLNDATLYTVRYDHTEEVFQSGYDTDSPWEGIEEQISKTAQCLDTLKELTGHRPAAPYKFEKHYNTLMDEDITRYITGSKSFDKVAQNTRLRNFEWLGDQLPE